jgi:hypothetical protein
LVAITPEPITTSNKVAVAKASASILLKFTP